MGLYAKVERSIWNSRRFRSLDDTAKLLYQYFLTCEHFNILGCFVCRVGYVADDLNWNRKKVLNSIKSIQKTDLIVWDEETETVLLTNHLKKDPVKSPQQQKGAVDILGTLPFSESIFRRLKEIVDNLPYRIDTLSDTLSHTLSSRVSVPPDRVSIPQVPIPIPNHTPNHTPVPIPTPGPRGPGDARAFEEFWEKVPRPMKRSLSKPQVKEKYIQAIKGNLPLQKRARAPCVTHGELMKAIAAAGRYYEKQDTPPDKYPMITTWLNQMRWAGDYGPPGAKPKSFRYLSKCPKCGNDYAGMEIEKCLQCGEPLKVKVSEAA